MAGTPRFIPDPSPSVLDLRTVIFATDLSDCSENAGRYAAALARQFGAELLVAHTFVLTQAAMEVEDERQGASSEQRLELEAALQHEATRLGAGLLSSKSVLLEGDPPRQISQLALQHESPLIVLGTHGRGAIGRAVLGSTAEKIVRLAGGPALTVGPHVPPCRDGTPPIQRLLYVTGLSPAAAPGVAYAIGIAQAFQAQMEVMHVVHPEDGEAGQLVSVQKRFAAEVAAMVPHHAGAVTEPHSVIATGTAHTRILEHLRENAVDLLVLSLRKSSHLWQESPLSGAFHIIAAAPCPVLTIVG